MQNTMFKKAQRQQVKLKLAITGPSGSGKTTAALRLAKGLTKGGKVALIDTENRSASLYADQFEFDVLDLEPPFEHRKFIEGINAASEAGYEVVILDSASHFWKEILAYKDRLDRRGGNSYTNWGEAGEKFDGIISAVLQSPIHLICCLRSKMDYVLEQNDKGKMTPKKVGMAPIMRDGVEYEFTLVLDLDMKHQAASSKDRTRLFDGKVEEITEKTGAALAEWLAQGAVPVAPQPAKPAEPEDDIPYEDRPAGLEDWLSAHAEKVNDYLVRVKWIKQGQTWEDLSSKRLLQINSKTKRFAEAAGIAMPETEVTP